MSYVPAGEKKINIFFVFFSGKIKLAFKKSFCHFVFEKQKLLVPFRSVLFSEEQNILVVGRFVLSFLETTHFGCGVELSIFIYCIIII